MCRRTGRREGITRAIGGESAGVVCELDAARLALRALSFPRTLVGERIAISCWSTGKLPSNYANSEPLERHLLKWLAALVTQLLFNFAKLHSFPSPFLPPVRGSRARAGSSRFRRRPGSSRRSQCRAVARFESDLGRAPRGDRLAFTRGDLRYHAGGDPPLGCAQYFRGAASRAGPECGAGGRAHFGGERARLQRYFCR